MFGNIADPKSRVSKLKKLDRDYAVLPSLLTKPRLTYLAKVRNPNRAMPDYQEKGPLSLQEFEQKSGEDVLHSPETGHPQEPHGKGAE